jgi:gas vesicle protein
MMARMEDNRQMMEARMNANECKMDANKREMMVNMEATIRSGQEETKSAINSIRSELEEAIQTWMENAVASLNQQNQALREELDRTVKERQRQVQTSIDQWTGNLQGDITGVKKDLQKELDFRAQGLEVRMAEVEARVELGVGGRTGNDAGRAKPPKFDGSTSWAMFRRQFETVADHNRWMPQEKATYSIAALQGWPAMCYTGSPEGQRMRKPSRPWRTTSGTSTWPLHTAAS